MIKESTAQENGHMDLLYRIVGSDDLRMQKGGYPNVSQQRCRRIREQGKSLRPIWILLYCDENSYTMRHKHQETCIENIFIEKHNDEYIEYMENRNSVIVIAFQKNDPSPDGIPLYPLQRDLKIRTHQSRKSKKTFGEWYRMGFPYLGRNCSTLKTAAQQAAV